MNKTFIPNILKNTSVALLLVLLASCGGGASKTEGEAEAEHHEEHGAEVELSPTQIEAIGVKTSTMERKTLSGMLKVNGRLMLPPQDQAEVGTLMGGTISRILVTEGQIVEKGQVLADLASTEFLQLQQDYLESAAQLTLRRADFNRQQELRSDNINAERTFQQAQSDLLSAEARQKAMAEKLKLFGVDPQKLSADGISSTFAVRAPIAGSLHTIAVTTGQYVEPNKPLFDITDNRALHIDLTVFEQDLSQVKEGQRVTFTIANDAHASHEAEIYGINRSFEDGQQAVIAHARMKDIDDHLLPGMFIDARIQVKSDSTLALPNDAIVSNGADHFIFVQHEENAFRQVQVRTGVSDQGYTAVAPFEPLEPSAQVVISGAYYLLSELTKGSGEHEH